MSNIDKQALREVAEKALPAMQRLLMMPNDELLDEAVLNVDGDVDAANAFNLSFGPETALALLDDLDTAQHTASVDHEAACSLVEENEELKRKLETAEKQIVELSRAANVNNQWKPEVCPVTGRQFFMWIEHETLGYVPTYGGPFDSYTIPTRDSSGEFSCERYDHDLGGWVGGEFIGLYLIDDDEQCRVSELEERIAELEAREVTLPDRKSEIFWPGDAYEFDSLGYVIAVRSAIRAAGIKVKGGVRCH
ncbi:ead/Ea22-like family protein [Salmonella enterica]|nr:ead/Ea22-like family protein [Salmonella enterica]EIR8667759.1 ead/Ea22-like family protein [Salmonella enterica]EKD9517453.1 ead/Ea22-like family protein [Salmonella enterica]EKK8343199.1 ead/Ea22-like family protein [Salmonella enterica]EKN7222348.1 ead/Ea22-like family protein [Salmonella enterica]